MYLDAFTISALVDEFMDTLVGGRVQDVIDVDQSGIGLEIYANRQRHYLYMSADKHMPRVHRVGNKLRRGIQRPRQIGLLMRRYVEGGKVMHVSQPPWERILQVDIEGPEGDVSIVIEPMERRANVLLLREGIILDCMVRVGPEDNRYRLSLPNHAYQLPPPMTGRYDPTQVTSDEIETVFAEEDDPKQKVARVLARRFYGLSPLLAKEIIYRAYGDGDIKVRDVDPVALHEPMQELIEPLAQREWTPGIAYTQGVAAAYSVYPVSHLEDWREVESISAAMDTYYGVLTSPDAYNEAKKPVQAAIEEGRKKFGAKLASLESGLKDESELDHLQHSGELILAYQYAIEPGQDELRAQYNPDEPELVIKLDPDMTPLENAQRYFDKYNRAKRALLGVPQIVEETKNTLTYLSQLENDLQLASNWPEIDEVVQALQELDLMSNKIKRVGGGGQSGPMKLTYDGYVIWVGRNSRQNEQVTFKLANKQDLWLHARDVPGAHVVIRYDGRRVPETLIDNAAAVAAYYSSLRNENKVIVDVTRVKYVTKIKGAGQGMVTYRNEETRTVAPQDEAILKQ